MRVLPRTYFGNPILRAKAKNVSRSRIATKETRELIYSKKCSYDWEGCLSFPNARGLVARPTSVVAQYTDERGKTVMRTITGYAARVFQHEIDHLFGALYADRMEDMRMLMTLQEFERRVLGQQ